MNLSNQDPNQMPSGDEQMSMYAMPAAEPMGPSKVMGGGTPLTSASLDLLGAGQPYMSAGE